MVAVGVVVLTGGTGRRLGGVDKARLSVGGSSLLSRAVATGSLLGPVVVVGPPVDGVAARFVREDPPGGGPAAALLAGVSSLSSCSLVVALAVDMPLVSGATLERLVGAVGSADGALLVDGDGREQYLCAAYSREALVSAAPASVEGLSLRRLVAGLSLVGVPALGDEARDVDTPADLDAVRRLAGG